MTFEWDEARRTANVAKHGLDFADVERIFASPLLANLDNREDYGETRWLAYGILDNRVVAIAYSRPRSDTIRFISLRKAPSREEQAHENENEIRNRLG